MVMITAPAAYPDHFLPACILDEQMKVRQGKRKSRYGVFVSAVISPGEKTVMRKAYAMPNAEHDGRKTCQQSASNNQYINHMKKYILIFVAIIAIWLVAINFNGYALLALLLLIPLFLYRKCKNKDIVSTGHLLSLDDAVAKYGEPDDCIVVDATRANEAVGCILVFKRLRILVAAGEPLSMDDIADVSTVNTATPYTVGQYQLVFTTHNPDRKYIRLEVGLDAGWANDVATQVIDALKA